MKKAIFVVLVATLTVSTIFLSWRVSQATAKESKILEFDTMVGLPQAFTGDQNPIRGLNGGGLPWAIGPTSGQLKQDGQLKIAVQGLVFSAGPNTGKNTIPAFRAIVSCLTQDGATQNVMTDPFPATEDGNAKIKAKLNLPQPCLAPIIFITSPNGAWFAVTGS